MVIIAPVGTVAVSTAVVFVTTPVVAIVAP